MRIYLTICVPSHPGDLCKIIISGEGARSTRGPAGAGWLPARRAALAGEWRVGNLEPARKKACRKKFYAGRIETCAATIRQPSGKRTQTWLCRPRTVFSFTLRSNSKVMLP